MTPTILRKEFRIERESMICGSAEAENKVYKKVVGDSGSVWLIPQNDSPGEGVHVHNPNDRDSQGYGGRTLEFLLTDGTVYKAAGPWHSNSDALYCDTGIDLRDKHRTFVVISLGRGLDGGVIILEDVIYIDDAPKVGEFKRGDKLAQELADKLNRPVIRYSRSRGGSSCGPEYPSSWTYEARNNYWKQRAEV